MKVNSEQQPTPAFRHTLNQSKSGAGLETKSQVIRALEKYNANQFVVLPNLSSNRLNQTALVRYDDIVEQLHRKMEQSISCQSISQGKDSYQYWAAKGQIGVDRGLLGNEGQELESEGSRLSAAMGDITSSKDDILKYEFVEMVKNGLDNKFLEERIMKKTE